MSDDQQNTKVPPPEGTHPDALASKNRIDSSSAEPRTSQGKGKKRGVIKKGEVAKVQYTPGGIAFASDEVLRLIHKGFTEAGLTSDQCVSASIDIARHCADVGSSEFSTLVGPSCANPKIPRNELAAIIKKHCTLRQHNALFAKIVWNMLLTDDTPPMQWSRKGFLFDQRFCAFDFFFGVSSEAAFEPEEGLLRRPTNKELQANTNAMEIQIYRKKVEEGLQISNSGMVTGGRSGPRPKLEFQNAANED